MSILDDITSLLLAPTCPICGTRLEHSEKEICLTCLIGLPRVRIDKTDDNKMVRRLWPYLPAKHAASVFTYTRGSGMSSIIDRIKEHRRQNLAIYMGQFAALETDHLQLKEKTDFLIPAPITKAKLRERGYNQALLIAEGISKVWGTPVLDILKCNEDMKVQKRLSGKERTENAIGKYSASIPEHCKGKRLMIVDDIFTTGATMTGCALALQNEDPEAEISIFTLAEAH